MATTSPLRQRMIEDMTIRNLSRATQQSYIYAVAKFSRHFNLSPDRLGMEEIRAYQLHLVAERHSWGQINQITCALRFFYGITLGQKEAIERIVFGREPEKLPPVLNADEITRFLEAVAGLRNRVALTTAYAAGLRVSEVARLKVASIESARMLARTRREARLAREGYDQGHQRAGVQDHCARPGSADNIESETALRAAFSKVVPGADFVVLPGVGHLAPLEATAAVVSAISTALID